MQAQTPVASFTTPVILGCFPFSVQFNNTSTGATSYYWDFGNGNYSTLQNPVNIYLSQGSFNVKLIAYNASGAADSILQSGLITTYNPPAVNFTASSNVVCLESGSVNFTNQSLYYDSCLWDFGDGVTSILTNPAHQYFLPGTYTVTLIANNTVLGCSSSLSKNSYINILSNPAATFSANVTTSCNAQAPINFQSQASSAISWQWQFGDGNTSALANPSHVYGQPGVYTVTLVTTNQLGCADTVSMPNYITILNNPVPVISSFAPWASCTPVSTTFSTTTPNIISYSWNFGDSITSQLAAPYHRYTIGANYNVTLQVNYANGCSNTGTSVLAAYARPATDYIIQNYNGCVPLTSNFINQTPGTGISYSWVFGDGGTSTQLSPTHVYTTPGVYSTQLTAVNTAGCSYTFVWPVSVTTTMANAQFTADDVTGCAPHTVNFTHNGGSLYTYNWNFGDGTTSTQQSPSHIYNTTGNYTVSLTVADNNGCVAIYTYPSTVIVSNGVNNFSPVTPVIACAPFTVNLFDNSPATSGWSWDFDDGTVSTQQNPVHTYTTAGTYNVSLQTQSSGNNCSQLVNPYAIYIIHGGTADFTATQTVCPPYIGTFTDNSINAVAWLWDFGDGTTATVQNPVHTYGAPGSYNVSLTITTSDGCTYTTYHNYAVSFLPLTANATATSTDTILPMTVNFAANSAGATMWLWDFGDGGTSTLQNPAHIYNTGGPYNITLTVSNSGCSYTYTYAGVSIGSGVVIPGGGGDSTVVAEPVYNCIPYEMSFTNPAINTVQWLWDFGDGDTSSLQNPTHIYTDPGIFTVSLITWNSSGQTDTIIQPSPFYLMGSSAAFNLNYSNNCNGSTLITQNTSVNAQTYYWDFGDGTTSVLFQPTHTYATSGVNYIVSLLVTDSLGCTDFVARSYYAATSSALSASTRRACAGDSVQFTSGFLNFAGYLWDFGDGFTSVNQNPFHFYADSGNYQVTLAATDTSGCTITWNIPFLISIRKPIASFTAVIDTTANPCATLNVQFTNTSTGAVSYLWNFGDGTQTTSLNPYHYFNTHGNHTVSLTASAQGCSSVYTVPNSFFKTSLTANFGFVQSSECLPVTVTYRDSSTDAISWLWDFGDGTSSTLQNPVHIFSTPPTGFVVLTVRSVSGCIKTIMKPNIVTMRMAIAVTDSVGCKPFLLQIADSSVNVNSLLWNFGDGTTFTGSAPSHIYSVAGVYTVTLTATAASGCIQVINPVATIKVTSPRAQFSLNSVVSCAPTIVNFNDNSIDATTWNWNFGDGNQSLTTNPVHIYNQPGTYDVTLVVSDTSGCADTLVRPALVHITGSIAAFAVSGTTGCFPWQVQFSDSSISAFSWIWNFGDGYTSTQQNPNHTYATPGSYVVTLITQDTTGCQSVYSNPVPLNVNQPPVAAFTMTGTTGCIPLPVSFTNQSLLSANYLWLFGDGSSSTQSNPVHTYNSAGTYYATLIAFNASGCADTLISNVPVIAGMNSVPVFGISKYQGCAPLTIVMQNNSLNTDSNSTYLWNFGNGATSTQFSPSYTYTQAGIYSISLTISSNNVCSSTVSLNNIINVSNGSPPPPVLMKSVSVADSNSIEVTWGNLALQNLNSYNLYRYNSATSVFDLVYTDNNPGNTSLNVTTMHTDVGVNTGDSTYTYVVQAENECGAATALSSLVPHTSINLNLTISNNYVRAAWNKYNGCSVAGYEIYRQDNLAGSFNLIGSTDPNTIVFLDSTVYCGMTVAYRILAKDLCNEGFTAWSDMEIIDAPGSLASQHVDLIRATVIDDQNIFTEWAPPTLAPQLVTTFELYKASNVSTWSLIATLPAAVTNFTDYSTQVHNDSYRYKIKVNNLCNLQSAPGKVGKSILLGSYLDDENQTRLQWSPYLDWSTGVDNYVIERKDLNGNWQPIKVVDGNVLDYIDR